MTPPEFFKQLQRNLPAIERQIMHDVIQVEAERFHGENFRKEGFTDAAFTPWQPRKARDKNPAKRALLVKSGAMRRHATKGTVTGKQVDFNFPLAYMRVQNEGGKAGRGKGFTMPKRQFVGKSAELEKRIERKVLALLNAKIK